MDENQESAQQTPQQQDRTPEVGFPVAQPKPKATSGRLVLLALALLILVGGGIFLFTRGPKEKSEEITPTPAVEGIETPFPTEEGTATPTSVDKSKIKIEVLNGTGIAGEAAYLQGVLKSLGYGDISVGNADSQEETTTTVTFARSLSSSIVDEITKKLEATYQDVQTKTSSTQKSDVVIVTGLKKGVTPKPTTTPTTTATPTATPTATTTP